MYRRLFYDRSFSPSDRHLRRSRDSFADGYSYRDPESYGYGPSRSTTYPWKRDHEMKRKPEGGSEDSTTTPVIKAEESGALGSGKLMTFFCLKKTQCFNVHQIKQMCFF